MKSMEMTERTKSSDIIQIGHFSFLYCLVLSFLLATLGCVNGQSKNENDLNHRIKIKISNRGFLFTSTQINGQKANTMIDFGDPNLLQISTSFVQKHKLSTSNTGEYSSDLQGNKFALEEGKLNDFSIANISLNQVQFLSGEQELEYVGKEIKTKIDAVVGWGFFKNYKLKLDYSKRQILLSDQSFDVGLAIAITYNEESNYLNFPVKLDKVEANLILDTGAAFSVLDSSFFAQHSIQHSNTKIWKYLIFPVNLKRIKTHFDDRQLAIEYYLYDLPRLEKIDAVGILGGTFLKKHQVIIHPSERKIYFL